MVVNNLTLLDGEQHQQLFLKHRSSEKASRHALGVQYLFLCIILLKACKVSGKNSCGPLSPVVKMARGTTNNAQL